MPLASEGRTPTESGRRHHANEQQRIYHHVPIVGDLEPVSLRHGRAEESQGDTEEGDRAKGCRRRKEDASPISRGDMACGGGCAAST